MQYEKLKNEEINIWPMLSIFTYQQIAQRLTTMHSLGKPFRTFIAVYAHSVEVLLDRKIEKVDDIQKIFTEKIMGEEAIYSFFELAKTQRSSEQIQKDAEQSIRIVSNMISDKEVLEEPLPFHWVIVTDRVQVRDLKKKNNFLLVNYLSNPSLSETFSLDKRI